MLSLTFQFACHALSASKRAPTTQVARSAPSIKPLTAIYNEPKIHPRWSKLKSLRNYSTGSPDSAPASEHPSSSAPHAGRGFDLSSEQYAELKDQRIPLDFQYKQYTQEPTPEEADEVFEPKFLDLYSVTELMARKRHPAAIKRAIEVLEPHRNVIQSGYPAHDPSLNASLRQELSECLGLLSMCYLHQEQPELAIDASMGATSICPTSENFSDLASNLLAVERYDEAIRAADRAIELDPYKEVDALVTKAYAIWKLKAFDRGYDIIGICDLALARDPYATTALEVKAEYLGHQGKFQDAVKTIERAIAKDDDNYHLTQVKIKFLEKLGMYPLAITTLIRFLKKNPEEFAATRDLARLALVTGDWKIAILHLKKLIQTMEEEHAQSRAKKSPRKSDEETSPEDAPTAVELLNLDAPYIDLAHALGQDRQLDEATKALEKAISVGNNQSIAFETPYNFANMKRSITIKRKNDAAAAAASS